MKFFTSSLPNKNQFSVFLGGLVSLFIFLLQITRDKTLDKYLNYEFKNKKKTIVIFFLEYFPSVEITIPFKLAEFGIESK